LTREKDLEIALREAIAVLRYLEGQTGVEGRLKKTIRDALIFAREALDIPPIPEDQL
jgi:hypothetical protein